MEGGVGADILGVDGVGAPTADFTIDGEHDRIADHLEDDIVPGADVVRGGLREERERFLRAAAVVVVAAEAHISGGDDDARQLFLGVVDGKGHAGGTIEPHVERDDERLELHGEPDDGVVLIGEEFGPRGAEVVPLPLAFGDFPK